MKSTVAVAVAISTLLLLTLPMELQGAPYTTSQELGRAVEQLQETIKAEIEKLADQEHQYDDMVTAQVRGINIRNCGRTGAAINSGLAILNTLFRNNFGVLVDCQRQTSNGQCVQVRVDVPADDVVADVNVCDVGGGFVCVEVNVEPTQQCIGIIPITIPIPLRNGQQINIQIRIDPRSFLSPQGCATVVVNAPQCPRP